MKPNRTVTIPIFAAVVLALWVVSVALRGASIVTTDEWWEWTFNVAAATVGTVALFFGIAILLKRHRDKMAAIVDDAAAVLRLELIADHERVKSDLIEAVGLQMMMLHETEEPTASVTRLPRI